MQVSPELVLAQWAAGMVALVLVVNRWRVVSPGYAWLVDAVAASFALFAWAAGGQARTLILVSAALAAAAIAASVAGVLVRKRSTSTAVAPAPACSPATLVQAGFEVAAATTALVAVGQIGASVSDPSWIGAVRALAGAAFLGAVTDSMILGHWYLIDPKLPKMAIRRLDLVTAGTLAANTLVVLVPPGSITAAFGDATLLALGWLATTIFCAVLVTLVYRALKIEGYASVMSATGLLYVATMVAVGVIVTGQMASG